MYIAEIERTSRSDTAGACSLSLCVCGWVCLFVSNVALSICLSCPLFFLCYLSSVARLLSLIGFVSFSLIPSPERPLWIWALPLSPSVFPRPLPAAELLPRLLVQCWAAEREPIHSYRPLLRARAAPLAFGALLQVLFSLSLSFPRSLLPLLPSLCAVHLVR